METNRRNRGGRARDVFFAAGITLAVMLLSWLMCPPTFTETNDDALMAALAYGTMARPIVFLAYMNVAVGYAIRALLAMFPGVGWYGVLQVGTVYVSSTVLSYLVLRRFRGWKALFPLSFLYLFFGFNLFSSLQFTRTAAVAVIAGFMLLFSAMRHGGRWPAKVFGALLAVWGSLFRFSAFGMLCLVFVILGIVAVIHLLRERGARAALIYCVPFAVTIAVAFGLNAVSDCMYNRNPDWMEFQSLNGYRDMLQVGRLHPEDATGFPDYTQYEELYQSLGITREDWELYSSQRNTADPTFLNTETLRTLFLAREKEEISAAWIGSGLSVAARTFAGYATYPALLLAIVIGISGVITGHHRGKRFVVLAWGFAVLLALQVYFFFRGKYALDRIDTSLFLAIVSMLLLWVWDEKAPIWDRRHVAVVLSMGILAVNVPAYTGYLDKRQDMREDAAAQAEIRSLIASDEDHFYFYYRNWGYFPDVIYDIWHAPEAGSGKNACLMGSWMVTTCVAREQWANYGVTNPYADMVNNEGIYLMCFNGDQVTRVLTHIQQHYNPKAKAYQVKSVGEDGKYKIYRITSKLPNAKAKDAVDGIEALTWSAQLKAKEEAGSCTLSGYAFRQGDNSFAANLYYGITGADGEETLNYLRQRPRDGADNFDGGYAAFKSTITVPEDALGVSVYYECPDGTVFRLPVEGR